MKDKIFNLYKIKIPEALASYTFYLICLISLLVPLNGVLGNFMDFDFTIYTLLPSIIFSALFPILIKKDQKIFSLPALPIILLGITSIFFFKNYSPVIEIAQDPSVYAFKSFNLVNHGRPDIEISNLPNYQKALNKVKESHRYSGIQNGLQYYKNLNKIKLDFFGANSYFSAFLGLLNKKLVFWGNSLFSIITIFMMFITLFKFFPKSPFHNLTLSIIFLISPLYTWFGRAPYSEVYTLFCFLLILFNEKHNDDEISKTHDLILILGCLAIYFSRIDMILALILPPLILKNRKTLIIYPILAISTFLLMKSTFSIYHTRIFMVFPELKYIPLLTLPMSIIRLIYFDKKLKINFNGRPIKYLILAVQITTLLFFIYLLFRLPIINFFDLPLVTKKIHGHMMPTRDEFSLYRLIRFFYPAPIIIVGLLYLPHALIQLLKKNIKVFFILSIISLPTFLYLYSIKNSPQLYWAMRRLLYTVVPTMFISYSFFTISISKKYRNLLIAACLLISITQRIISKQIISEMKGLDDGVKLISKTVSKNDLIIYDVNLRKRISPVLVYTGAKFLPHDITNIDELPIEALKSEFKNTWLVLSPNTLPETPYTKSCHFIELNHKRIGENVTQIPKKIYNKKFPFWLCSQ